MAYSPIVNSCYPGEKYIFQPGGLSPPPYKPSDIELPGKEASNCIKKDECLISTPTVIRWTKVYCGQRKKFLKTELKDKFSTA